MLGFFLVSTNALSCSTEYDANFGLVTGWSETHLQRALTFIQAATWLRDPNFMVALFFAFSYVFICPLCRYCKGEWALIYIQPLPRRESAPFLIVAVVSCRSHQFFPCCCMPLLKAHLKILLWCLLVPLTCPHSYVVPLQEGGDYMLAHCCTWITCELSVCNSGFRPEPIEIYAIPF